MQSRFYNTILRMILNTFQWGIFCFESSIIQLNALYSIIFKRMRIPALKTIRSSLLLFRIKLKGVLLKEICTDEVKRLSTLSNSPLIILNYYVLLCDYFLWIKRHLLHNVNNYEFNLYVRTWKFSYFSYICIHWEQYIWIFPVFIGILPQGVENKKIC